MQTAASLAVGRLVLGTAYERYNEVSATQLRVPHIPSLISLVDSVSVSFLEQEVATGGHIDFQLTSRLLAWRAMARGMSLGRTTSEKWTNTIYELHLMLVGRKLREIVPESDHALSEQLAQYYEVTEADPRALGAFGQFVYDLLLHRYNARVSATRDKRRRARTALHAAALACEHSSTVADRRRAVTDALEVFRTQFPSGARNEADRTIANLWDIIGYFIDDPQLWRDLP